MKNLRIFIALIGIMAITQSCEKLDLQPTTTTAFTEEQVYSTYEGIHGAFLKLYSSMAVAGQGGVAGNDVAWDGGRSVYLRSLFWVQECPSDLIIYRTGTGYGIPSTVTLNWTAGTEFPAYFYYRAYIIIALCNEFLRRTETDQLSKYGSYDAVKKDVDYWRAEARFIRAFQYYQLCDLYGDVGFVDDSTPNGTFPVQKTRKQIFEYVEKELLAIESKMLPSNTKIFGRVNQLSADFLLAKLYLNAQIYTGTGRYNEALTYAKKVIDDSSYSLAPNYIENFLKDNNTSPEILWAIPTDNDHMQGEGVTNYLLKFPISNYMLTMVDYGISATYSSNGSLTSTFVDKFLPEDQDFNPNDTWGDLKKDKRALLFGGPLTATYKSPGVVDKPALRKQTWDVGKPFVTSVIYFGYTMTKWRSVTKDRVKGTATVYSNIAFPMFRKADAYLMAAEAILRGATNGTRANALSYVNEVRDRAYNFGKYLNSRNVANGQITDAQLTLPFLIDERARELWTENWRRSDLIRFGIFTKGYNWDWKGRSTSGETNYQGQDVDDKFNLYPIPQNDVLYNPNLKQNPNY
ncbi:RagB/SusD family nutrient uptake outer membrane protein [Nubsella zeaxanthinifaciens]|uniref:RagB/SusD family nutrient uptake outer membrane protein n=1 Tax=Nubsella zeaxanthinifaciens TaxID=392412 RepID=UPI0013001D94|nr:RagB/SusD family nutrient uptake outer membrane protein [Nubsella zeaxanthinifaciens]